MNFTCVFLLFISVVNGALLGGKVLTELYKFPFASFCYVLFDSLGHCALCMHVQSLLQMY